MKKSKWCKTSFDEYIYIAKTKALISFAVSYSASQLVTAKLICAFVFALAVSVPLTIVRSLVECSQIFAFCLSVYRLIRHFGLSLDMVYG